MIDYEGFRKVGKFTLNSGVEVFGELSLKGMETSLDLYADEPFTLHDHSDIVGMLYEDWKKVSLINCFFRTGRCGNFSKENTTYVFANLFPHLILFGNQHISSDDQLIERISFFIDDNHTLFYDTTAFGIIHMNARSHLERLFDEEKYEKKRGKKIEIGSHPRVFYYTGKFEIISIDTVFGKISANNYGSERLSANKGISLGNTIKIDVDFKIRKTIEESIDSARNIVKFLEIIAGRPQNISKITCSSKSADEQRDIFFDVYLCATICHEIDNRDNLLPSDLPIQAALKPDEFSRVLKCWTEHHEERRDARNRFSTAFAHQNNYTVDRLVGAANMFDILPASACPQPVVIPVDLEEARCNARKMFKSLPVSPERDSVLNALGRIGKPSLKRKVRHRAKWITDIVSEKFPEIELVIDQAIDLRNYYVHGTDTKIDYGNNNQALFFLTDTLEFIFAASDLVESGWDIAAWIEQRPFHTHPFGRYLASYRERLEVLKKLLAENI